MAFDAFLELDGIPGDSQAQGHAGSIEIETYSWGLTNSATIGTVGGGAGSGKATFQDIQFTAFTSKASPLIAKACATGQHIQTANLHLVKAGGSPFEFITVKLQDVIVTSYQQGGAPDGDAAPTDSFSLLYLKIEFDYTPQKADGSADAPVVFTFDVAANRT
jgi:type VI secretion system secreted protein Hcp